MPGAPQPRRGPGIVEPVGYAVSQFVTAIALVAGIGLAPNGLLLAAAAILGSVIDLRRFRVLNPGVIPETAEEFDSPRGKILMRASMQGTVVLIALGVFGMYAVHHEKAQAAAIGPALIGGVVTLWLNWRIKTGLTRVGLAEVLAAREREAAHDAEMQAVDDRARDDAAGGDAAASHDDRPT